MPHLYTGTIGFEPVSDDTFIHVLMLNGVVYSIVDYISIPFYNISGDYSFGSELQDHLKLEKILEYCEELNIVWNSLLPILLMGQRV